MSVFLYYPIIGGLISVKGSAEISLSALNFVRNYTTLEHNDASRIKGFTGHLFFARPPDDRQLLAVLCLLREAATDP